MKQANTGLMKIAQRLELSVGKKVEALPHAEYGILVKCTVQDPDGTFREAHRIVGTPCMAAAMERMAPELMGAPPPPAPPPADPERFLEMPGTKAPLVHKLRELLHTHYQLSNVDNGFQHKKQIYKAVAEGAAGFDWWAGLVGDDTAFHHDSLMLDGVAEKVYGHLAVLVTEGLRAKAAPPAPEGPPEEPPDQPEEPMVECTRNARCNKPAGHVGNCKLRLEAVVVAEAEQQEAIQAEQEVVVEAEAIVEAEAEAIVVVEAEQEMSFNEMLNLTRPDEPFRKLTAPADISRLGTEMDSNGDDRLAAYATLQLDISPAYARWFRAQGKTIWEKIRLKFPDHMKPPASALETTGTRRPANKKRANKKRANKKRPVAEEQEAKKAKRARVRRHDLAAQPVPAKFK